MKSKDKLFASALIVLCVLVMIEVRVTAQTTLFTEDFESASIGLTPPAGWAVDVVSGSGYLAFVQTGTYPDCNPTSGIRMAEFRSYEALWGTENRLRMSTPFSTVGYTGISVDFDWLTDPGYGGTLDRVNLQYSLNGSTWNTVSTIYRYSSFPGWQEHEITLPEVTGGQASLYIAFDFISEYGNNCHLDRVRIKGNGPPRRTLFTEDFESAEVGLIPPAGWGVEVIHNGNYVKFQASGNWPTCDPYSGTRLVEFQSFNAESGSEDRLRMTTPVSTVNYSGISVDFWWLTDPTYSGTNDRVNVQYSLNGSLWKTARTVFRYGPYQTWTKIRVPLPQEAAGAPELYIGFDFISAYGNNCHLDLVNITGIGPLPPMTVTVGNGTVSCPYPFPTFWMGGRTQLLYTAEQLSAAGLVPGTLTGIGFNVVTYSGQTMQYFNLSLKNTSETTLTEWVTGMHTCYMGSYAVSGTGWQMIGFQDLFVWSGQNLVLEICYGNNGLFTSYSYVYGTEVPAGQVRPYWQDNLQGCTYSGVPHTGYTGLPNLKLVETPTVGHLAGVVSSCFSFGNLPGVEVSCGGKTTLTDSEGHYTLYDIPVGSNTATYGRSDYYNGNKVVSITGENTTTANICLDPIPSYFSGHVVSAATGHPIVGAMIEAGSSTGYSTGPDGAFVVEVLPYGNFPVSCSKTGFETVYDGPYNFIMNQTITQIFELPETVNTPGTVVAGPNEAQTQANLTWDAPFGYYESVNDNGIPSWGEAQGPGYYHAVRYTPAGFPCMLGGVNMYIGMPDNYPPGANPFVNMHFLVFDASGPGGLPGTIIDGPFNFIPANFGWNTFLFGSTVTIGNGDFYIVHVQDGVYPLTSCVFTDNSAMSDNSFLRDMPNGNWEPAGGNIMMRALLYGPGGPEPAGMNTTGYQVYRFTHGQEGTPADWVSVTSTDLTECIDPAWGSLPNNIYLWAVKAVYSGNRFSDPSFSNYLEKVQPVTVVQNLAIGSGQDPCIEASQTVIIAGGETFFIVADGGSADIVAGHNILLYPWTKIYSGGYLHAFITTNGQYCPGKKEAMVAAGTVSDAQNDLDAVVRKSFFSVYPNPTDGIFTLELNEDPGPGDMVIRIYSITGEQVFTRVLPGRTKTEIDLGERPSGIYIVKVNAENGSGSARIIRR